ncbi:MAG: hypothetical protein AB8G23_16780 [Myxococcota bacterium]
MSFNSILQEIVDQCGGGFSASLMGLDGIAIDEVRRGPDVETTGRMSDDPLRGDVTDAGIEFGRILNEMTKASEALGAGSLRETVVCLSRVNLIFHAVDEELILVLSLHPDGNLGKARYLIRRSLPLIRAEL